MSVTESKGSGSRIGLSFVVFFVNAFLLVTFANAALSFFDDMVTKSAIESAFYAFRAQLSALHLVLALLTIAAVILVPHLPKFTVLPPLLVLLWELMGAPGFTWSMSDHVSMAKLDAILLGAVALGFVSNKLTSGTWFISTASLPYYERLFTRTLIAAPIAAIAIVVVSVAAVLSAIPIFIEQQSRGYLHFASNGLEVRETILSKGDQVVHLVGMVHIGEPEFYRKLYASIPPHALILAEGVTDREGRMKAKPSYDNAAKGLGLESQGDFQKLLAGSRKVESTPPPSAPATPSSTQAPSALPAPVPAPTAPFVVFADIDVSELSPSTLRFLEATGTIFQASSLSEATQRYMDLSTKFTEAEVKAVMDEIVLKRNQKALSEFDKHEPQFKVIYLPWGALHMPDFEDKLITRGYKIRSSKMLPIARYETIMNGVMATGRSPVAVPNPASAPQ